MKYVWLLLLYPLLIIGLAYVALRYLFAVATAPVKEYVIERKYKVRRMNGGFV